MGHRPDATRRKGRDQDLIWSIDREAYSICARMIRLIAYRTKDKQLRSEVVDHDILSTEPGPKREHRKSRPFPEFS